jgi:hypothetical protein
MGCAFFVCECLAHNRKIRPEFFEPDEFSYSLTRVYWTFRVAVVE